MATLKTNTLTGTSTADAIAVTGEGNSTTTNLQQGLAKMWCHLDMNTENTRDDTFNNSSITDRSTGKITVVATNAMASINYTTVGSCWNGSSDNYSRLVSPDDARTTTNVLLATTLSSSAALLDGQDVDVINFGDLA
jgi:hypothetical protein